MWVRGESVMLLLLLVHQSQVLPQHQTCPGVAASAPATCCTAAVASAPVSHGASVMVHQLTQVLLLFYIKVANAAISSIITDITLFQLQQVSPKRPKTRPGILSDQ